MDHAGIRCRAHFNLTASGNGILYIDTTSSAFRFHRRTFNRSELRDGQFRLRTIVTSVDICVVGSNRRPNAYSHVISLRSGVSPVVFDGEIVLKATKL